MRFGLPGSASVPQSSATCMSWGGVHYRTFDRKHFHFQGSCTYLLASSTDGTWAVYISTVCDGREDCSKVLCSTHFWDGLDQTEATSLPHNSIQCSKNLRFPHSDEMWTLPTSSVHSCSSYLSVALCFQALRMMLGLDLVAVHRRNLTLNNMHIPNGQPLFQNGKNILRYNSELFPFLSDY